jgi:hypothetical protein
MLRICGRRFEPYILQIKKAYLTANLLYLVGDEGLAWLAKDEKSWLQPPLRYCYGALGRGVSLALPFESRQRLTKIKRLLSEPSYFGG